MLKRALTISIYTCFFTAVCAATVDDYTIQPLGALDAESTFSEAFSVNDDATACGQSKDGLQRIKGFVWSNDVMTDMGEFVGSNLILPRQINNLGQICGFAFTTTGLAKGFYWTETDGFVDIGNLGGSRCFAFGINNLGQVTGYSQANDGAYHAFIWSQDTGMQDLGTLGGLRAFSQAINNNGDVAVLVHENGVNVGYLRKADGTTVSLGNLGTVGQMTGLNDNQQIVGRMGDSMSTRQAFIWDEANGLQTLGTLGGDFSDAQSINNAGSVVGYARNALEETRAFLWNATEGHGQLMTLPGEIEAFDSAFCISEKGVISGRSRREELGVLEAVIWTSPFTPNTADEWIDELDVLVDSPDIAEQISQTMNNFIDHANDALDKDKDNVAVNNLNAFINHVNAMNDNKLTQEQKDELIAAAQAAIDLILNG